MELWATVQVVSARMGASNLGNTATAALTTAITAAQMWVQSTLETVLDETEQTHLYDLSQAVEVSGFYALKCNARFISECTAKVYASFDAYVADDGEDLTLNAKQIASKGGYVLIPATTEGFVELTYTAGFASVDDIPPELVEAMIAYVPSVLKFAQVNNVDNVDYQAVIKTAKTHARDLLLPLLNNKHAKALPPLTM